MTSVASYHQHMNIYLLKRRDTMSPEHDAVNSFVVAGWSIEEARILASRNCGDEGAAVWLDPGLSSIRRIGIHLDSESLRRTPYVVCRDFNAG